MIKVPSQPLLVSNALPQREREREKKEKDAPSLESISSFTLWHIGRIVELGNSFISSTFSELDSGCGAGRQLTFPWI